MLPRRLREAGAFRADGEGLSFCSGNAGSAAPEKVQGVTAAPGEDPGTCSGIFKIPRDWRSGCPKISNHNAKGQRQYSGFSVLRSGSCAAVREIPKNGL